MAAIIEIVGTKALPVFESLLGEFVVLALRVLRARLVVVVRAPVHQLTYLVGTTD